MQDFRNVDVWNKAHDLTLQIYKQTQLLPKEEVFGITIQLRRAAISIATRIAEGCGRDSNVDFAVDLRKAAAACNKVEYLIVLAKDLKFWSDESGDLLIESTIEVRKMIYGLLRKM